METLTIYPFKIYFTNIINVSEHNKSETTNQMWRNQLWK